jgi:Phosphoesterase family
VFTFPGGDTFLHRAQAIGQESEMASVVKRVVVMIQENHTTDNYFRGLAPFGGAVASDWPLTPNPPASDPPHNRRAYFDWLTGASAGDHVQFDTRAVLPYYLQLALTGAFLENHCSGFGTNSTPNHLLLVGGQSPTLKNPSSSDEPVWDMPSVFGLAESSGVSWRAYAASQDYPVAFYTQLQGSPNVVSDAQFVADAKAGQLPALAYLWHNSPNDEHPPDNVTTGMNTIWQAVDAVVQGGAWADTVVMLTWDCFGGYDDHVRPPALEYTPDNVQLSLGPRVPLLMFGGAVKPGIDSRWNSHVSIPKTAMQLLGLPALGVPRLDQDPGLADLIDQDASRPANPSPPAYGSTIDLPPAPNPPVAPHPTPPPPAGGPVPVGAIILRDGSTLPPPNDAPLPRQPSPPA